MTKVAVAARAADLGALHAMAGVADRADVRGVERLEEARPAGARFELAVGAEQRQRAQAAGEYAISVLVEQAAAERAFGAMVDHHAAFVGREFGREAVAFFARQWRQVVAGSGEARVRVGHGGLLGAVCERMGFGIAMPSVPQAQAGRPRR